jgi:hypothetical protein
MVRNRSWPAVSHYLKSADAVSSPICAVGRGEAYDLKLHRLAVELDGPDFLRGSVPVL